MMESFPGGRLSMSANSPVEVFQLEGHVSHYFIRDRVVYFGLSILNSKVRFVVCSHSEFLPYQVGVEMPHGE